MRMARCGWGTRASVATQLYIYSRLSRYISHTLHSYSRFTACFGIPRLYIEGTESKLADQPHHFLSGRAKPSEEIDCSLCITGDCRGAMLMHLAPLDEDGTILVHLRHPSAYREACIEAVVQRV